ncbi:MAG TPA: zinc metalloprotease HtpX [Gammaproteobacteria bacterium]|jgi:heat shock protein HtpX|nr:zinc metalloprotease HtpX [Gammaproteobacteria bacterium]
MADNLDSYHASTVDWRNTLRQNNRRTYVVIALFFLIYCAVGLLIDVYMQSAHYPRATISQLLHALITFQLMPWATLIMLFVASISLLITYTFYDKFMLLGTEYHEINPETATDIKEKQLYNTVQEMQIAAGLRYMPKVFIINADYMNAFASGYSEKSAMIAITRGLLEKLNRDELQAVMAHELSHIRHLDIKLTLTASLLANMTIIVLDMFFYNMIFSREEGGDSEDSDRSTRQLLFMVIMILRYALPIINVLLLLYLSRTRELMADAGCVQLTRNNQPLASALIKIQSDYTEHQDAYRAKPQAHENLRRESYIFDPTQAGLSGAASINDLFSTHPSLETRLAALGFKSKKSF